jgi:hypothetical protein
MIEAEFELPLPFPAGGEINGFCNLGVLRSVEPRM